MKDEDLDKKSNKVVNFGKHKKAPFLYKDDDMMDLMSSINKLNKENFKLEKENLRLDIYLLIARIILGLSLITTLVGLIFF